MICPDDYNPYICKYKDQECIYRDKCALYKCDPSHTFFSNCDPLQTSESEAPQSNGENIPISAVSILGFFVYKLYVPDWFTYSCLISFSLQPVAPPPASQPQWNGVPIHVSAVSMFIFDMLNVMPASVCFTNSYLTSFSL